MAGQSPTLFIGLRLLVAGQSSTLFIGLSSLRFLVPVKRFHNEWSLHFINTFPASIEMGFSLSPD